MKFFKSPLLLSVIVLLGYTAPTKSFFDYKNSGKFINAVANSLTIDSVDFIYGIQSYQKRTIEYTTCFYNHPTDVLHYVLSSDEGKTIHFEIPLLQVLGISETADGSNEIQIQMAESSNLWIKEFNKRGGLIHQSGVSVVRLPIDKSVKRKKLVKNFRKIFKRADSYQP